MLSPRLRAWALDAFGFRHVLLVESFPRRSFRCDLRRGSHSSSQPASFCQPPGSQRPRPRKPESPDCALAAMAASAFAARAAGRPATDASAKQLPSGPFAQLVFFCAFWGLCPAGPSSEL
eukprot:GHVT01023437.1.p3 GENE.GHVT01023437.1~~GHVT01023437.1.p3  ORF type:complete len:120 (+),score=22.84 GHVT01023437.1:742-1101(+)